MKRIIMISAALMLAFLAFNPIPVSGGQEVDRLDLQLIDSSAEGISLELRIPWRSLQIEERIIEGKTYLIPSLPGATQSSQPGAPELPVVFVNLGVPFGTEFEILVTPGKVHEKTLSNPILPVETEETTRQISPDQHSIQEAYSIQSYVEEDKAIYNSSSAFPTAQAVMGKDAVVRQQRIVGVKFYPLQYEPAAGKLLIYESIYIEIRFLGEGIKEGVANIAPESEVYESFYRQSLLNYESAKNWRSFQGWKENNSLQSAGTMWLPPEPSWRILVQQDGMYRLTYEELEAAGLPVTTLDPSTFQMYHLGSEIAILVNSASANQFIPGDSLVFYGEKIENKYTRDNVYWLTFGHTEGLQMEPAIGTPGANPIASNYQELQRSEQNLNYINYIPSEDIVEHFVGKILMPQHPNPNYRTISISFNLDHVFDGSGLLKLALLGYLNASHQATITLNGTVLPDDITWNAFEMIKPEISLPTSSLIEGVNTVVISSTNTQDLYYLDWIELFCARELVSTNDTLFFDYEQVGNWNFNIEGFSAAELNLFDVSNPDLVRQIIDFSIESVESTYTLQFAAEVVEPKRFWSGTSTSYLGVESIVEDVPSNWQASSNGADYIVITHEAFVDQALELADFRASQGLRVQVVDVQDLYDEFGFGITGSEPIRAFLSYAYGNWESPVPSYAVLIGDGHFDPKNYMGYGRQSYIPPYLASVDPELGETAADNRYVAFVGEDVFPDMMLGRLTVNTTVDAQGFVNKIIAYEESSEGGDWNRQVLAVSDSYDSGWPFPFLSDDLLRCCLPSSYEASRVYLEVTHANLIAAREAILEGINAGKLLVNYIGHAAASQWSSAEVIGGAPVYGVLNVNDISSLNNLNKYPVMLSMTCWDGYYVYPNPTGGFYEAMAEVYTKAANKGAVAAWSPTGMGVARGHEYLNQGFFNAVFRDRLDHLGQATSYGKLYLWTSRENLDLMDTYLLFGDPATKINVTRKDLFLPLILK